MRDDVSTSLTARAASSSRRAVLRRRPHRSRRINKGMVSFSSEWARQRVPRRVWTSAHDISADERESRGCTARELRSSAKRDCGSHTRFLADSLERSRSSVTPAAVTPLNEIPSNWKRCRIVARTPFWEIRRKESLTMPFSGTRASDKGREPDRCSEEGMRGGRGRRR